MDLDLKLRLVPLQSPGLKNVGDARVHAGFLQAYNAVALEILQLVGSQLRLYPSYNVVVAGHSLGGALAALGAISIRNAGPHVPIRLFTFGMCLSGTGVEHTTDQLDRATQDRRFLVCRLC